MEALLISKNSGMTEYNNSRLVEAVRVVMQRVLGRSLDLGDRSISLRSLGLDSVAMVELISALETEFHIRVLDEDISPVHFRSIDSIAGYLEGKL